MQNILNNRSKISFFHFIFIAFFLFSIKWIYSIYSFEENILFKIILDSDQDSIVYFPFIKDLSILDFSGISNNDKQANILFPIGSVSIHTLFYKFFGVWSLILLEFFCILFFLIIFFKIINLFLNSFLISIFFALILFSLSSLLFIFNLDDIKYLSSLNSLYSLRFPRPMISHLLYFYFVYLIFKFSGRKNYFSNLNAIKLSIILSFSFMSFHNIFFYELLLLILLFVYSYKAIFYNKYDFIKFLLLVAIIFFFLSFIFFYLYYGAEPDYLKRFGLIDSNLEIKIILLKHFFNKTINGIFILLVLFFIATYVVIYKRRNNYKINKFIFFFGITNLFSLFLMTLILPKIQHLYHYVNIYIINFFLIIFLFFLQILKNNLIRLNNNIIYFFILLIIVNYNIFYIFNEKQYLNEEYMDNRQDLSLIIKKLEKDKVLDEINKDLLIFDGHFFTYLKFLNKKDFVLSPGIYSSNNNFEQEDALIRSLKFIGFDKKMFANFIKNEISNNKYQNKNMQTYFLHRYQANTLTTFQNTENFTTKELNYIKNSSPLFVHQSIIPKDELIRIINRFENSNEKLPISPDLILINRNEKFRDINFQNKEYCRIYNSNLRQVFIKRSNSKDCN